MLRRIETVTFNDEASLRRHTSVHFELPRFPGDRAEAAPTYVPLGLLEKVVLTHFDVRDEAGNSLPMLPRHQNAKVAAEVLRQQAAEALRAANQPPLLYKENATALGILAGEDLDDVVTEDPVRQAAIDAQAETIAADAIARSLIEDLSRQFLLLVRVRTASFEPRVIKFAYDAPYVADRVPRYEPAWGWFRKRVARLKLRGRNLLEVIGICSFRTGFATPAITDAQTYHVELVIPEELYASSAQLHLVDTQGVVSQAWGGSGAGRVHLYVSRQLDTAWGYVLVEFVLRPALVAPVFFLSAVTSLTLLGGVLSHSWWHVARHADTAAALIVALPTFFAPVVAPGGHRLVRRMFKGLRGLVGLSALISFVAAATLALNIRANAPITTARIWTGLLALSAATTAATAASLFRSWRQTQAPTDQL